MIQYIYVYVYVYIYIYIYIYILYEKCGEFRAKKMTQPYLGY